MSASNPIAPAKEAVTAKMSRWASTLQFKDIAPEAVYQAKRFCSTHSVARWAAISNPT